ncbi:MAG TPA: ABC transporter permease [Candidatus Saccharimonadales bacterium]|nr:ABC transporter permease [Candidatus Saccharimonadales bacterium]
MRYLTKRNRAILREMVSSDFKVRYQGSVLGYLWSLLRPLFMFAILYVIFVYVFKLNKGVEHYPVYLLFGMILWNFFYETTMIGMTSVVARGDLIRKISIPRYLVVLSSSASALINLGLNLLVVLVIALFNGVHPHLSWLLLPVILLELVVLAVSAAFFLATLYVKFRDITYIWEVILQAGFYGTPVLYSLSLVPAAFRGLLLINPLAQVIQDARYVIVTKTSVTAWGTLRLRYALIPVAIVVVLAVISVVFFKRSSKYFAENI